MICIDLTKSDDDDILYDKKQKCKELSDPFSSIIHQNNNNSIFNYYYGTEDLTEKYLSIQHPLSRKVIKPSYTIKCPKCPEHFINCNFLNHIIDHYKYEYSHLDHLLTPRLTKLSNIFNDTVPRKAYRCEICLIDFDSAIGLGQHLQTRHVSQDMPYVCFVCNFFRTSVLTQLRQHFYDCHKATEFLFCPFCIQPVELSATSTMDTTFSSSAAPSSLLMAEPGPSPSATVVSNTNIVLDATAFIVHLEKHLLKKQFPCDKCVLRFPSKPLLMFHKTVYHQGSTPPPIADTALVANNLNQQSLGNDSSFPGQNISIIDHQISTVSQGSQKSVIVKKSLNVTTQPIDVSKLMINTFRLSMVCGECRDNLSSSSSTLFPSSSSLFSSVSSSALPSSATAASNLAQHFQSYNMCIHCGYRSYCAQSFRRHVKTFHNQSELSGYRTIDIFDRGLLICPCGYQSMHGDGMACHLYRCREKTCFVRSRICGAGDRSRPTITTASVNDNRNGMDEYMYQIDLVKREPERYPSI